MVYPTILLGSLRTDGKNTGIVVNNGGIDSYSLKLDAQP